MSRAVTNPGRDDKSNPNHLLRNPYNKPTDVRMRAFTLVDRYGHTHEPHCPTGEDPPYKNHAQISGSSLENSPNKADAGSDLYGPSSANGVHDQTAHQRTEDGTT